MSGTVSWFVIVFGLLCLSQKLALILGLPPEWGTAIQLAVMASVTVVGSMRRRNPAEAVFVGVTYLCVGALLGLLYTIRLASQDSSMLPYAVVLFFVVVGLGTLVVSLRQSFYPAADDIKKEPAHPLADDLIL